MDAEDIAALAGLLASALVAATILPMQSEAVLAGLLLADRWPPLLLLAVASTGNTLGAVINWGLGRALYQLRDRPWFPASGKQLARAERWFVRYGKWTLLLSWVPLVGDPLTVIAGTLGVRLPVFVALVALAKTGRYLVLVGFFSP